MALLDDFWMNKDGLRKVLGDLEAEIMEVIWSKSLHTVRDVYEELRLHKKIAYTTVMTVMGRLAEKGLLRADKEGTAYHYYPTMSREEFERETLKKVVDSVMEFNAEGAINYFAEKVVKEGKEEQIKALEELLRKAKGGH